MNAHDYETIPNIEMVKFLPEPTIDSRLSDPAKIEAARAGARKKQIDKMALSPLWGRICSFSIFGETKDITRTITKISDEAEKDMVSEIFSHLSIGGSERTQIVTWNGMGFDIPYLYKRAAILRVPLTNNCAKMAYWTKRYSTLPHCDLMQVLANWNTYNADDLDSVGKVMYGIGKTERDYSEYVNLINTGKSKEISEDNRCDAELTYRLYLDMKDYLF